jgi:glyoxylase-like metal-dependent hydrolase (beta-lactamase superfamily II)
VIRIERVLAPNPGVYTLEGTNTWIVGREPALVIDPGPEDDGHLTEVARVAGRVGAVLVTHDHEDHAGGAAAFSDRVGAPLHAVRVRGAEPLEDGRVFASGDGFVRSIATPGHAADHVAFLEPVTRSLFTGDAVLGRGTSFIDPPDGDLAAYLASLEAMLELAPRSIRPGHGPVRTDARELLRWYAAHRAERETQILAVIEDGPATVAEVVARVYDGQPDDVLPLAARSVTAHLVKLEGEDRVARDGHGAGQRWTVAAPKACARCGDRMRGPGSYCRRCMVAMLQGGSTTA